MTALSILIPSRNEPYLQKTVEDILEHSEADTDIYVGYDGYQELANVTKLSPKVHYVYSTQVMGQRAMTNMLAGNARLFSQADYLMKIDAHCSFSQGFDRIMLEDVGNDLLNIDLRELDVEKWQMKPTPLCSQMVFNTNFDILAAPEKPGLVEETMIPLGVGFMVPREKWPGLIDESFGSWGLMGLEVALKTWLRGDKVKVTKKAQMGHWYKQGEKVPYPRSKEETQETFNKVKEWARKQDIGWLIKKFDYPADWKPDWEVMF